VRRILGHVDGSERLSHRTWSSRRPLSGNRMPPLGMVIPRRSVGGPGTEIPVLQRPRKWERLCTRTSVFRWMGCRWPRKRSLEWNTWRRPGYIKALAEKRKGPYDPYQCWRRARVGGGRDWVGRDRFHLQFPSTLPSGSSDKSVALKPPKPPIAVQGHHDPYPPPRLRSETGRLAIPATTCCRQVAFLCVCVPGRVGRARGPEVRFWHGRRPILWRRLLGRSADKHVQKNDRGAQRPDQNTVGPP
jgi:hypothetical protein